MRKAVKKLIDGDISQLEVVRDCSQAELEDACGHLHYELTREAVADVLRRYASGEINAIDAQLWASFVQSGYLEPGRGSLRPIVIEYQSAHWDSIAEAISRLDQLGNVVDGQMDPDEAIELLTALFTHPSNIQDSMEYIKERAPEDVLQMIALMESSQWRTDNAWGGSGEPFGNLTISFSKDQNQVIVVRDRDQWFLEIKMAGWTSKFDLGLVLDAMNGREAWDDTPQDPYGLRQLPNGVSWVQQLPEVLGWLASLADGESELEAVRTNRWRYLHPDSEPSSSDTVPPM